MKIFGFQRMGVYEKAKQNSKFCRVPCKFLLQLSHFYYFFIILGMNIAAKEYFRLYLVIYKLGEFIF